MRKLIIFTVISILIASTSTAFASTEHTQKQYVGNQEKRMKQKMNVCHGDVDRMKERNGTNKMFSNLKLTVEQQQKMEELTAQLRTKASAIQAGLREAMYNLITSNEFNELVVREHAEKSNKIQVEHKLEITKIRNQMYNILTVEQKNQFNKNWLADNKQSQKQKVN